MQNGKYIIQHKMLNTQYNLTVYNGKYKLFSIKNEFIKYTELHVIQEFCTVVKKLPASSILYNIHYYVNGKLQETIYLNSHYGAAKLKISALQRTSHKIGKLIPMPV